jgi:hypothetical protein
MKRKEKQQTCSFLPLRFLSLKENKTKTYSFHLMKLRHESAVHLHVEGRTASASSGSCLAHVVSKGLNSQANQCF